MFPVDRSEDSNGVVATPRPRHTNRRSAYTIRFAEERGEKRAVRFAGRIGQAGGDDMGTGVICLEKQNSLALCSINQDCCADPWLVSKQWYSSRIMGIVSRVHPFTSDVINTTHIHAAGGRKFARQNRDKDHHSRRETKLESRAPDAANQLCMIV